jgi:nucleoside-diphosphate-sugar epimerase
MTTHYVYSIEKAGRLLGYRPQYGLEQGIERTVKWYRDHHLL